MPFMNRTLITQYTGGMGGGLGCSFTSDEPVPENHGGLESGTVIKGMTPCDVLTKVLYPYEYPRFTSFYIDSQATLLEVGDKVTGGTRTFKWVIENSENLQPSSISIIDLTANSTLASNLANDGTEDVDIGADKQLTAPGVYSWQIKALDNKNDTFSKNFDVVWQYRVYWGASPNETLTSDEVLNLAKNNLKSSFAGTYSFTVTDTTGDYFYIVYPDSWGDVNQAIDCDTSFGWDMENVGTVDVTNSFGVTVTYRLYRTTYKQTTDGCVNIS